jgi:hypothetical protein
VIINGGSRAGAGELAAHLGRSDTNEAVEVLEIRGLPTGNLRDALRQMEGIAAGTNCRKSLYHANIDPDPGEAALTEAQQWHAIERLEQRLRLRGHPRVVVAHLKQGRSHLHVVWSRIDQSTMKAVHDGHNYRLHEAVSRELEQEFGHRRVQGAHEERAGQPRPARTLPADELRQAARTSVDPKALTAEITSLWHASDSGRASQAALVAAGYQLARGDRRDFVLVDRTGGVHSLARRITGIRAADVRAKLADLAAETLPSIEAARLIARARPAAMAGGSAVSEPTLPVQPGRPSPPPCPAASTRPQTPPQPGSVRLGHQPAGRVAAVPLSPSLRFPPPPGSSGQAGARPSSAAGPQGAANATINRHAAGGLAAIMSRPAPTVYRSRRPGQFSGELRPAAIRSLLAVSQEATASVARGFAAAAPAPLKGDRSVERPVIAFCRTLGVDPPYEVVMWAMKQKRKLIAYSCATGENIIAQLEHLERIISGAYLNLGLTVTGKQRHSPGPS